MRMRFALGFLVTVALAATAPGFAQAQRGPTAAAELKSAKGQTVGRAELNEGAKGVMIRLHLEGAPAGDHAFHIHQVGKCDAPTFQTAGPHLNPTNMAHGVMSEKGAHLGDLPNVHVPAGGALDVEVFVPGAHLAGANGILDADGAALVLHAQPDDYRTDPSGSAGDRIACGVITKS
jgi:Cu-Zn family superoxide dismutase